MSEAPDAVLDWLQRFYLSECDGDWEHGLGFTISTLDNPGWSIDFDLESTPLENKGFAPVNIERTQSDWAHCRVEGNIFQGRGGPTNLTELLVIFRQWAEANRK